MHNQNTHVREILYLRQRKKRKSYFKHKDQIQGLKVLSNTDHMTLIPFGHFAIVLTS